MTVGSLLSGREQYKSAKFKEKRLRGRVCVEYVDDEGMDAGAIRGDFFEK